MGRHGHAWIARRTVVLAALGLCAAAPALAGGSATRTVHARLLPVAPARYATGTFTGNGASGGTVVVRWQLSVSKLSGPAKKATLQTPAPRKIIFTLCQPCKSKAHGKLALLGSVWSRIAAGGGTVVVTTKAHPRGELRGAIKHG